MWLLILIGVVACAVGGVWIGQGLGMVKGSFMSGHIVWTVIGALVVLAGLAMFRRAWRLHRAA